MKTFTNMPGMVALVVLICAGGAWAANPGYNEDRADDRNWASKVHKGTVVGVSGNTVTVEGTDGVRFTAHGDANTPVTYKDKKGTMADLQAGLKVVITPGSTAGLCKKIEVVDDLNAAGGGKPAGGKKKGK